MSPASRFWTSLAFPARKRVWEEELMALHTGVGRGAGVGLMCIQQAVFILMLSIFFPKLPSRIHCINSFEIAF